MTAQKLVRLTRFSPGSLNLTDPASRRALAREIREKRRAQAGGAGGYSETPATSGFSHD